MTNQEINHLFDTTNITLQRLSMRSGLSVAELKKMLMETPKVEVWQENK